MFERGLMARVRREWSATWSRLDATAGLAGHLWLLSPVLALALILRLAVLVLYPQSVAYDALTYDALAVHLLSGQGYVLEPGGPPTATRGPVYPLFLAGIYWLFGHRYLAVFVVQALVDVGTVALTYAVAWSLYRRRDVGLLAALAYTCYLPFALQVGQVMTETLFTALLLLGIYWFLLAVRSERKALALGLQIGAGVALGLAALTRPAALLVPLVLAAFLPWLIRGWRRVAAQAAALLLTFILVLVPWTWWNWQVFHALVPTSTLGGINLYIGQYTLDREDYLATHTPQETRRMVILTRALEMERASLNEVELDQVFRDKALALIRRYPLRYLHMSVNRLFRLWFNLGYAGGPPSAASWVLAGTNGIILGLALVGLFRERTAAAPLAAALGGVLIVFTLFHVTILAYVRFIFPVMPLALVLAARGGWLLAQARRGQPCEG